MCGSSLLSSTHGYMMLVGDTACAMTAQVYAFAFHSTVYRRVGEWDLSQPPPGRARLAGAVSISTWLAIIFTGRMIGYFS